MKKLLSIFVFLSLIIISCSPKLSPDQAWANQRWVLKELKGVPVQLSGTRRDAYIEFTPADKRFSGNAGCNRISGNYTLEKKNRISLGEVISTKMSCNDIAFETAFLASLKDVDRYELKDNALTFKDGNKVMVRFEPVAVSRQ
jgi:heat shock protein HslJ